jgi:signal transduction histidine kinase/DNA-binding NarL/FixJ family response regulator
MAGGWLVVGMVLLAGAQLHNMFWPSVYSPVLTTADLLRLAFAVVVTIGGIVELRAIASRRAALLAAEQEHSRRLAELSVLKANFTAMVAHELGSPLAAICRIADLLDGGQLDQRQALDTIRSETSMLATLVDDMQTAGAVERTDFATQPHLVPLNVLLTDATAFARTLPGDHPLTTAIETYARVVADPERIGQVLRNLLNNAAKYAPPGTPIELRAVHRGEHVRIEVADHGYGIHPDDMPRIFEKFGRGRDRGGRKVAGAGLGLYLSRRIVQAHGSELTVESTPGVGSVFGFDLPVAPSAGGEPAGERAPIRVLIVDDHLSFRQPLSMLLEQEPQISVVGQAGTLAEARQMLEGVDVALVDLDLPDGSGIDLIEDLSAAHARTVILTASNNRREIVQAIEAGATAVVHKAAHVEEIKHAVQQVARGVSLVQHKDVIELLHGVRREREREREAQAALAQLTPREREVLQALSEGLSDKEIAQQLYVSPATIELLAEMRLLLQERAQGLAKRHLSAPSEPG